jgi:S-formylglutathione hydrolase FrmB
MRTLLNGKLNKSKHITILAGLFFLSLAFNVDRVYAGNVTIIDSRHYSTVFGEVRNFRIFLPPGYYDNPQKKYPVIYFLHGWSQRYFGSGGDTYSEYDKGVDNKGDNIASFVSSHEVIVVKSDGYDRNPEEKYYVTPYNVDRVETHRQFPIYFPELVNYIDANYKTIGDRGHRAISGLSMGGFMTFWIGGKYPQLFSAAGSFCGSTEFKVGPKNFPVSYRHSDMYKNYGGMNVRLNTGDKDFIRGYNEDLTRVWTEVMDSYECKIYDSEHNTCGLGEMFGFFLKTFENPPAIPQKWAHIDLYPEFSVWEYNVSSDRTVPGFTILENVDKRGFRCSVRDFIPDGELMPFVNVSVTTPPIYEKNQWYVINDVDTKNLKTFQDTIQSDNSGSLKITMNGSYHEIGINKKTDKPNICIASFTIENMNWATHKKEIAVSIKLLNKGLSVGKSIRAALSATKNSTSIFKSGSSFGDIDINNIRSCEVPFTFQVQADSIGIVKLKLTIRDEHNNEWIECFEILIKKDLPEIKDFIIADGKKLTVAQGGNNSETVLLGLGNGDGVPNAGESIVVLVRDQNKYWRTNLHFSDKFLNPFGINIRMPDSWNNFDHVGEAAKYVVPVISSDCPEGHNIELFAEYWLPDYPLHIIKQGTVKIKVNGEDNTPPQIRWINIYGDNNIQVKINDGSKIQSVRATLILKENPAKSFEAELKDDGKAGDRAESDNVFSKSIPEQKFGFFRVIVEAMDSFGNKTIEEAPDIFILH